MTASGQIHPVVLSGGTGTRLWPMSRASLPKQLLALHGKRTMIQNTVLRANVPGAAKPILLCNEGHRFLVAEQMQAIGVVPEAIVLEPIGRNTAPAAAVAALIVAEQDANGIVLLLPSDHVVTDDEAFRAAIKHAVPAAERGYVVTFGIAPGGADTGYGYIQCGASLDGLDGVAAVRRFAEKPDIATAETYLRAGDYVWNSGMFVFRAGDLLAELDRHEAGLVAASPATPTSAHRHLDFVKLDTSQFGKAKNISIDYAVMEKTDQAAVVRCVIGWSDTGPYSPPCSLHHHD